LQRSPFRDSFRRSPARHPFSPFIGRLDDVRQNGLELLAEIVEIYGNYDWKTEVLAASIRHPIHVTEAARIGADVATMPFKVMEQLIKHPLTD
jgi:transaldolase